MPALSLDTLEDKSAPLYHLPWGRVTGEGVPVQPKTVEHGEHEAGQEVP